MSEQRHRLHVVGMSCANCQRHVVEALRAVPGVVQARVDLTGGLAEVTHDAQVTAAQLVQAVVGAGYTATVASISE
ncbi:MAG: cation transporter [Caulobacterales bacterium]|nr:cation transporter [Caulobacterales bacterium]